MKENKTSAVEIIRRTFLHLGSSVLSAFRTSADKTSSVFFKRYFTREDLKRIEDAVAKSETKHRGEIAVILEGTLPLTLVWKGITSEQRARELFSQKRIWDTEENTGILIYVQLAEKKIELLADRGIYQRIGQNTLDEICGKLRSGFAKGVYAEAVIEAVETFTELLRKHFPAGKTNPNELPDRPEIIG
ncbi:hypothetical protein EHQ12_05185 [Leptospira gomenensis]|uniref:TPM domain-containing protein n=1 Tax=Leptospira gomenensis TaxID=2484974 RepID=A0A5F1YDP1_9LEPT|nr:TPM domain-containing protein [Leptospira gomenensis]TGK36376.1 hypothetical protein EHQ17_04305 [Leptospira gomenensis]TGK42036.1 hypothetical protein EHQ12_05185 [Leptospira gomenensis]TGK48882.1 hypothetical protein EHQ07_05435 [Leptospira gomenensis]TGK65524.1 hypothetical protein EHQ13_05050 [Leptospira gomenensis]